MYVDYIWRYEWTSGPVENVAAVYFASNEQTLDGDNKFFANEYPILPRAMTFVLENGFSIQESLDRTNQAYQAYFNVALESAIQSFYILSIVPVAFLFIGVALYIIPSMRVLVDWQADILSTVGESVMGGRELL